MEGKMEGAKEEEEEEELAKKKGKSSKFEVEISPSAGVTAFLIRSFSKSGKEFIS